MMSQPKKSLSLDEPTPIKNDYPFMWDLVIEDMKQRDEEGLNRYGTRLQPFNGRDNLIDLYQELLDSAIYIRTLIYEQRGY